MRGTLKLLLPLFLAHSISAQTESPINTDRPDQSDGTYILTKKSFQIEDGFFYAKDVILNNLMVRYGITQSTEARLLVDAGEVDLETGMLPIGLSVKQRLCNQQNLRPAIVSIGYSFFDKVSFFTEYFAHFESDLQPSHNVDMGVLYLVNNRFQLDIAGGTALSDPENSQFVTAGFSYRFGQ